MNKKQKNKLLLASSIFMASITVPYVTTAQVVEAQEETQEKSSVIISDANELKGTKYLWGGTTPNGFDCSGFVQYVFKQSSIDLPRTTAEMSKKGSDVAKKDLQDGDLVFFSTGTTKGKVTHVGIYIGDNKFIHSATSKGVIVTDINDKYYWGSKFITGKRVL